MGIILVLSFCLCSVIATTVQRVWTPLLWRFEAIEADRSRLEKKKSNIIRELHSFRVQVALCSRKHQVLTIVQGRIAFMKHTPISPETINLYRGRADDIEDIKKFLKTNIAKPVSTIVDELEKLLKQMAKDDLPVPVARELLLRLIGETRLNCENKVQSLKWNQEELYRIDQNIRTKVRELAQAGMDVMFLLEKEESELEGKMTNEIFEAKEKIKSVMASLRK